MNRPQNICIGALTFTACRFPRGHANVFGGPRSGS